MVSAAGLILSSVLGGLARRIQVQIINRPAANGFSRVPGYLYSTGFFIGGYLVLDSFIDRNRELLNRRLEALREQRAQDSVFYELDPETDPRVTAAKRSGVLFRLLDKFGQPYK